MKVTGAQALGYHSGCFDTQDGYTVTDRQVVYPVCICRKKGGFTSWVAHSRWDGVRFHHVTQKSM